MKTVFRVNDEPFFVLGGQVHNSSAYEVEDMEAAWQACSLLKCNTLEVPVYWEQIEPLEGHFDFVNLDRLIVKARERGIKLILLWFATWKNGSMQYAPVWVKADPERFPRVVTHAGNLLWVLSSHSSANWEADSRAFCSLLSHLLEVDGQLRTVIGIQIENEPGILGSVRDYSLQAEREFVNQVPDALLKSLKKTSSGPIRESWLKAGGLPEGTWEEMFGSQAAEYFTTWSIARYIDRLAEAGKKIFPIPMLVNVWLRENGWQLPGSSYPAGGATSNVIDLWKWASPHIDLICPDIYIETPDLYRSVCTVYQRVDNPLFIPESGLGLPNALNMMEAIANFQAIGYAVFGIESLLTNEGELRPEGRSIVESFRCISAAIPLIKRFWSSGQVYPVIQREFMEEQRIDFGDYLGLVEFAEKGGFSDFRHASRESSQRGRGLIFFERPRTFYLVGTGYRLRLKKKGPDRFEFSKSHDRFDSHLTHFLQVAEGLFDQEDRWVVNRYRNGDEIDSGLWVAADVGIVRAELYS